MRKFFLAAAVLSCSACGGEVNQTYTAPPASYLIQIDQLPAADFTAYQPSHLVQSDWLIPSAATEIQNDGLQQAAQAQYWRQTLSTVSALAISNGPYVIYATVAEFHAASGAADAFDILMSGLDARKTAVPVSTGPLGDQAHAVSEISDYQGLQVVEITVIWRLRNLINSIVITGRYGGARLDDALALAHAQNQNELDGGFPRQGALKTAEGQNNNSASATPTQLPSPPGFIP